MQKKMINIYITQGFDVPAYCSTMSQINMIPHPVTLYWHRSTMSQINMISHLSL